ncbi:MAG: L-threonylcarbamoyladenylate synthase [Francisellaceae bacterium]
MSQYIEINPYGVDKNRIKAVIDALNQGAVIAYPSDSGFALGCKMGLKKPLDRIKRIRGLDDKHNFTLICRDLSEISHFAIVDNISYRILKKHTPGGYTFILPATSHVPSLMLNKNKKTVGIRLSDHPVPGLLSEQLGQPLLSTTLILPDHPAPVVYADEIPKEIGDVIDIVLESDYCGYEQTTVIDLTEVPPRLVREGSGDVTPFI